IKPPASAGLMLIGERSPILDNYPQEQILLAGLGEKFSVFVVHHKLFTGYFRQNEFQRFINGKDWRRHQNVSAINHSWQEWPSIKTEANRSEFYYRRHP